MPFTLQLFAERALPSVTFLIPAFIIISSIASAFHSILSFPRYLTWNFSIKANFDKHFKNIIHRENKFKYVILCYTSWCPSITYNRISTQNVSKMTFTLWDQTIYLWIHLINFRQTFAGARDMALPSILSYLHIESHFPTPAMFLLVGISFLLFIEIVF